jgi:putative ABC transport system permease protein
MLQNYFKIAWRNLLRRRFYSILNVSGLAVGLTFALLIGTYVWDELRVNRSLRNADRQCLVRSRWKEENRGLDITTLAALGPALKKQYPTLVASYYRFHGVNAILSKGSNHLRESIQIGDSTVLAQFGFELLHGNPRTALNGPNALVITAEKAQKYFGRTDVLNQSLTVETPVAGKKEFQVTGVLRELRRNSVSNLLTEPNGIFMAAGALPFFGANLDSWLNPYIVTYVELQPGVRPEALNQPLARLIATNAPPDIHQNLTAYVTPLTEYHLDSNYGLVRKVVLTLSVVAVFILLMAVVNFVNLALGSATERLREIGVRKVLGSLRRQVTVQFLLEALALTVMATGLSVGLYALVRVPFGGVIGQPLPTLTDLPGWSGGVLLSLALLVGVLAGGYPALHLSGYSPVESLRGKNRSVREGRWFRRSLVTVQFAIAVFVFIGSVFISRQIRYFFDSDLGFTKQALLTVSSLPRNWSPEGVTRMEAARDAFARIPGVQSASLSYEIPNGNVGNNVNAYPAGRDSTQAVAISTMTTDEYFAQTYQIDLRSGTYFRAGTARQDSSGIVLNETAVRVLGYPTPEAVVGQQVRIQGSPRAFRVLGVVNDFHFGTLHTAIQPIAIGHVQNVPIYRFFSFRLAPGNPRPTLAVLERAWRERFPDAPCDYAFMDQTLQSLYQTELQLERASYVATGLALFVVLLGVVGMVSLSVARRTKEVGIRKVLGASVPALVGLFLIEYLGVLLVANALAWPLAYGLVRNWLANYAYRAPLTPYPFFGVGVLLALLTGLVISLQVMKTAFRNPVKSLRSE